MWIKKKSRAGAENQDLEDRNYESAAVQCDHVGPRAFVVGFVQT